MNISEETYARLVARIGELKFRTSGGEAWGLQKGAEEAARALGFEIDGTQFHRDLSDYENERYDKQEAARLEAEAEDGDDDFD